jgi:hypothetical protein
MGHDSRNLLGIAGYTGALLSPVNETEASVVEFVAKQPSEFEFIFDPQLYFPRRSDRGQLGTWSYFPKDFDTADMGSPAWWSPILDELANTAHRVSARVVCSPAVIGPATLTNEYYEAMRVHADSLAEACKKVEQANGTQMGVLQTLIVRLADLAVQNRSLEIASIASASKAQGIYLVMLSDVKPRDELRDVDQLKGAMRLINALEGAGLPVLVGCTSTDVILWKAAGATACATGKFANLRRFSPNRFSDQEDGGSQTAYWAEELLLAFLRQSDLERVKAFGIAASTTNPFGKEILEQIAAAPSKAWVALGWRQYMHWFADFEARLSQGVVSPKDLVREAEKRWQTLEENDVFMEERMNDGTWLRSWLRAIVEFNR